MKNYECSGLLVRLRRSRVLLIYALLSAQMVQAAPFKLTLDLGKSKVKWVGTFLMSDVKAQMKFQSGDFVVKDHQIVSGKIVADMKSIQSDSGLDAQLKGPMLLNVDQFPTAELVISKFSDVHSFVKGGANARIEGTLTFRGQTHPVKKDFVKVMDKNGFHVIGTFKTKYGSMVDGELTYEIFVR